MTATGDILVDSGTHRCVLLVAACPFPVPRGTPIRILRMAEALGNRGHDVHVVTYHLGQPTENLPFHIHRIPRVATYHKMDPGPTYQKLAVVDVMLAAKVLKVARALKPDIIHAHHYEGLLAALPAHYLGRYPMVFDSHVLLSGELEYYGLGMSGRVKRAIGSLLDKRLSRLANHVIAVTEDIRSQLVARQVLPAEMISVIGNGVESAFLRGGSDAYPADGFRRIIFSGNLAGYQGLDLLLKSFSIICGARADVRLVIATDSDTTGLRKLAREAGVLDRIEFPGAPLDRLPSLIASADVAVSPRTECPGVPQKVLNYLAAGGAIVSYRGSAKHIAHGVTGLVVDNGDTAGFARAIVQILDDAALRERLVGNSRKYAVDNLSWERSASQIESVYRRVLDSSESAKGGRVPRPLANGV